MCKLGDDVLARFPKVWCSNCQKTVKLQLDVMHHDHMNDHDACDLMCSECKFVIATLHAEPVSTVYAKDGPALVL